MKNLINAAAFIRGNTVFRPISTYFMSFRHMHVSSCVVICRDVSKSNFATDGAPYFKNNAVKEVLGVKILP